MLFIEFTRFNDHIGSHLMLFRNLIQLVQVVRGRLVHKIEPVYIEQIRVRLPGLHWFFGRIIIDEIVFRDLDVHAFV